MIWLYSLIAQGGALEIPHETFTLDNGLQVILIEDHTLPQVVVNTWYGVGSFDDPPGASGFAHLFEHLMFMGTTVIPNKEFDVRMEVAGGWNNASTADDRTNYYDVGGSGLVDLLLFMEADRMVNLDITQEKLNLQRDVVRNERRQNYEDAPYGGIWLEVPKMMYPSDHPYHLEGIGSHEDLLAATLKTVNNFYNTWYQPANASLCVAGDFDPIVVKQKIQEYYGGIQAKQASTHAQISLPTKPEMAEHTMYDKVPLPAMMMMWHSPVIFEQGDAEADVLASLLAGRADAVLTQKLVYDQQLVQDVSVYQYSRGRGSMFFVYVDALENTDLQAVRTMILEELQKVAEGKTEIDTGDLEAIVNNIEMGVLWSLEDIQEKAEILQKYRHYKGTPDYLTQDIQRYKDVTPAGIQSMMQQYITADKVSTLYVFPQPEDSEEESGSTEDSDSQEGGAQ